MTYPGRIFKVSKANALAAFAISLISFAAGSLITARMSHLAQVKADGDRVFELRVYHAVPGKVDKLESRFREKITPLFAKHNLTPMGFWVPEDPPASGNTFIYILAHPSREEAKKNWDALFADPGFAEVMNSEKTEKLVEGVDSTYMRPTDFSAMK
jgi:hypothetical protein